MNSTVPAPDIADRLGRFDRRSAHRRASRCGHARCGRFFDDLLMPALDRAVALVQVNAVAVAIGEDLDLDVSRASR